MRRAPPLLIVAVALLIMLQSAVVLKLTNDLVEPPPGIQAKVATGTIILCINRPPTISHACDFSINQSTSAENYTYFCQVNYTLEVNETVNITYTLIIQNGLEFSVNESGFIRIWANQTGLGLFSSTITVSDGNTGCALTDNTVYNFQILDINDPPIFSGSLQGVTMREGSQISYGIIGSFFYDPDQDELTYTVSGADNFNVVILPSSEVIIINPADQCEDDIIYFTATDPYGASADSNMVTLDAECIAEAVTTFGGGGSSSSCMPEWKCHRWSECYPNSTRSRKCVDLSACDIDNLEQIFWEACEYVSTCFDGIQNQDETGIDCGGVCPACPAEETCFDGLKNQGEEDVDCGGPCDACVIVESCFDGIMNQQETGVDCGGSCEPCKEIHVPGLVESRDNSLISAALLILLIIAAITILYLLFRKEIRSIIARIDWWIARKKRKQVLLTDKDKRNLLKLIRDLEKRMLDEKLTEVYKSNEKLVHHLLSINRFYLMRAFDLRMEFTADKLQEKAEKVLLHNTLKNTIKLFTDKQIMLENKNIMISKLHLAFMIQELKQLVLSTSNYLKADSYGAARELPVSGNPLLRIVTLLHNSMIALQYFQVDIAQTRYLEIIKLYELLSDKEKNIIFNDVSRLYTHIGYELAWI